MLLLWGKSKKLGEKNSSSPAGSSVTSSLQQALACLPRCQWLPPAAPAAAQAAASSWLALAAAPGSLLAMKCLHKPVVALAGLEQEWPGTGLAGMVPIKYAEICKKNANILRNVHPKYGNICEHMQIICKYMSKHAQKYAKICEIWTQYAEICSNMQQKYTKYGEICRNMHKNMQTYLKYAKICKNMQKKYAKICTKI